MSNSCFRAVETNLPNGMEGDGVELTDSGDDSGAKDPSRSRLNEFFATFAKKMALRTRLNLCSILIIGVRLQYA